MEAFFVRDKLWTKHICRAVLFIDIQRTPVKNRSQNVPAAVPMPPQTESKNKPIFCLKLINGDDKLVLEAEGSLLLAIKRGIHELFTWSLVNKWVAELQMSSDGAESWR